MASRDQREAQPGRGGLPDGLDQPFDEDGLYRLRAAVAAHAGELGAGQQRGDDLLIIAGELASNAIRHGGGRGRLRLWRNGDSIHCRVSDAGPGLADPDGVGRQRPPLAAAGGRGLWVVRQMARDVEIETGPHGTTVTAIVDVKQS
jgi:anti-sigma regulatory factor (Ser/Thr protein kinase)